MYVPSDKVKKLTADLDKLNAEQEATRKKAMAVKKELEAALAEEQADVWGLTVEEYAAARKPMTDREALNNTIHANAAILSKLNAKISSSKYTSEQKSEFSKKIAEAVEANKKATEALAVASQEPLSVLLNRARRKKGLEVKKAIAASAKTLGSN